MSWLNTIFTFIVNALATALGRRDTTPAPPPSAPPPAPGFDRIEDDEEARLRALRAREAGSTAPVAVPPPPRVPAISSPDDRAEDSGAMNRERVDPALPRPSGVTTTPDDPYEEITPEPSTKRPG